MGVTESHTNPEGNPEVNREVEPSASADEDSIQSKISPRLPPIPREEAEDLVRYFVIRHKGGVGFAPRWRRHRTDAAQVDHYISHPHDFKEDANLK